MISYKFFQSLALICCVICAHADGPQVCESSARFMGFNIWGDYFKNPVEERDAGILATIRKYKPDLLALQEMTQNWWNSRIVNDLINDGYAVVKGDEKNAFALARARDFSKAHTCNHEPLFYRTDRYQLLEEGFDVFHARLDWSKGVTWAVLRDLKTKQGLIAYSTHFWWQKNGNESDAIREQNAEIIKWRLKDLKTRYPFAVIGGGDLNSVPGSWAYDSLSSAGYCSAAEIADVRSQYSSRHGNPIRDENGVYRGKLREVNNTPATSLDHVFVETNRIHVQRQMVVVDQMALDSSDHSPIVVDFAVVRSDGDD